MVDFVVQGLYSTLKKLVLAATLIADRIGQNMDGSANQMEIF